MLILSLHKIVCFFFYGTLALSVTVRSVVYGSC